MRTVNSRARGRRLKVPYPETLEEVRDLCETEEDFFIAARHGLMQKMLSVTWQSRNPESRMPKSRIA